MTYFKPNTTLEDKAQWYVNTVGLSPQEAQVILTPVNQHSKESSRLALHLLDTKVATYIESLNTQFMIENPTYNLSNKERMAYEEKKKTEDALIRGEIVSQADLQE